MAGTLTHEAGVPLKRAQEILGHASEPTTLAIYTRAMRRTRDDSADKIAELAGLSNVGNKRETTGSVEPSEAELSDCFSGSPGWICTEWQAIEIDEGFLAVGHEVPRRVPSCHVSCDGARRYGVSPLPGRDDRVEMHLGGSARRVGCRMPQ